MTTHYVNKCAGKFKIKLAETPDGKGTVATLLWGDPVQALQTQQNMTQVKARDQIGWVPSSVLGSTGILEMYIIDVGQGDGVLMRTPDDNWHLIDAGISNSQQMTRKGAANFIRWKFIKDLGLATVSLKNVIVTHPDFDHYGGLLDVMAGDLHDGRTFPVTVENYYHNGIGRFDKKEKLGAVVEGETNEFPYPVYGLSEKGKFITELLDDKASFLPSPGKTFNKDFQKLADLVATVPEHVARLNQTNGFLPGYEPGANQTTIRVLGPILENLIGGGKGYRSLGGESIVSNGHSIVLKIELGNAKLLLTGDLNTESQKLLLSYQLPANFNCDVAKGCHHGSDDIHMDFVKAMGARATVISSGDNEDYAHPRPRILGASAFYGRKAKPYTGEALPPLLYSTELARSVRLAYAKSIRLQSSLPDTAPTPAGQVDVKPDISGADFRKLSWTPISTDLVYGLVNVRTDGTHILCGYMEESGKNFDIQVFHAGVDPA